MIAEKTSGSLDESHRFEVMASAFSYRFVKQCAFAQSSKMNLSAMIRYIHLGRVSYPDALRLQEEMVELRREGRIGNVLLLLEHPPVLTLGRNADRSNVLASNELLAARGVTLHAINRGGDVTYHGPGQLVGYPIFDLRSLESPSGGRMGPVDFVRQMEETLIRLCAVYGVRAGRIAGLTGVWCGVADESGPSGNSPAGPRKIGAIGIHVSRGITSHGFAFNVTTDLSYFQLINPCGITDKPVTSLAREVADPSGLPGLEQVAHEAALQFGSVFRQPLQEFDDLADLRASAPSSCPPSEDTTEPPLKVPAEVERLAGLPPRPVCG
jgi:lipoyl(octanoyl) transferase